MIDKEKVSNEYAEAVESMDNSVDTDISTMQRNNRKEELTDWDVAMAESVAADEGIELTDEHMQVVQALRDYYCEHGEATGRVLTEMLDTAYADQGGQKYLRCLFLLTLKTLVSAFPASPGNTTPISDVYARVLI
jgi:TusE/DsrC/DsvC family sulfur relay protein